MKNKVLNIAYELNLFSYGFYPLALVLHFYLNTKSENIWEVVNMILFIAVEITAIGCLILHVGNLIIWYRNGNSARSLLLILFLGWFYNPSYYKKAKTKNWI